MEKALCRPRNQVGAGGEFKRQPQKEDREEVQHRGTRDRTGALRVGAQGWCCRVGEHQERKRQAPRAGERGRAAEDLSLIHISEPTRLGMSSYAVFCLKKKK